MDSESSLTEAQAARSRARCGQLGTTRGVALGYVQCNLVVLREPAAYDFLLYCQRNQKACPVLEVTDVGNPEPRRIAKGADLRTDLPKYAVYRDGKRCGDEADISPLWEPDMVGFLIGSGITFDEALQRAGVPTDQYRWVLRSGLDTEPTGRFHGKMVVTMRWLTPEQVIVATQVTARFPWNHGAPIHVGPPEQIGADLDAPLFGGTVGEMPDGLVPVFWACGVTPQAAAEAAKIDLMITHAPAHGFVSDLKADELCLP